MSRTKSIVLALLALLAVGAGVFLVPTVWGKPWAIDHFYGRVFLTFAVRHPMMLSGMRLLEPMGIEFHNDDLDDFSLAFEEKEAAFIERQLEILRDYDRSALDERGRISFDVLDWFLADLVAGDAFRYHDYPINQLRGLQSGLPDFMINTHHLGDAGDAEDYVARVGQFERAFDQVIEGLELRQERGIVPPRWVIDHVLAEMRGLIEAAPEENLLYTHLAEKTAELELDAGDRQRLLDRLAATIEGSVYPGYRRLIDFFDSQRTIATDDDGVWKLPDGEAYYAWALRHHTTTDMTADEIHRLGLEEVAAIQAEMRSILEAEGYDATDLAAAMNALNTEERFLYPDTDEGRAQIIADYKAMIAEIDEGLAPMFNIRPEAEVTVERVPEFRQATAAGAYYNAAPFDGSKPGIFYINLRSVLEIPKFGMRTLAYHEAIPGHHFQIGLAQEMEGVPFFRRVIPFTAFTEGWALYAEKVAAENGFQDDPYDRLGYLTGQVFRAVRLVVDTGLHAKRWTREEAIEYMLANTGMPETDVVAEIERYIVNPGQACAYKVGQLEILALRERATAALGDRFDIRGFHDVMLGHGAVPLSVLGELVERWIEEELAADAA